MNTKLRERKVIITIDSNLEDVVLVGLVAKKLCASLSFSSIVCNDIELSVSEAVNNAIIHAYGNEGGYPVEVNFTIKKDRLVINVCDHGKKMTELSPPSLIYKSEDRKTLPESGMGLFIINQIMDEVVYETKNDTNILTMIRRIEPDCALE